MNKNSNNRLFATQSSSFRQYAENYDEVIKICEETGRKPAEVLRDAIDEWLCMRRSVVAGNGSSIPHAQRGEIYAKKEELQRSIDQLTEQYEKLAQNLYMNEILIAVYGAINLLWRDTLTKICRDRPRSMSVNKL
jgi:hypothetical protein